MAHTDMITYIAALIMGVLYGLTRGLIRQHERKVKQEQQELLAWQKELEYKASKLRK